MEITDKRKNIIHNAKEFYNNLRKDDSIYIIGSNKYGLSIVNFMINKGFNVKGFINDYKENELFDNYSVFKSGDLNSNDVIINCVVEGRTIDVKKHINTLKTKSFCDYFSLQLAFQNELIEIDFLDNTSNILNRKAEYQQIYQLLYDEQSQSEFSALTNFRLNRDINYLVNFKFRLSEQYFEDFFDISLVKSFVDGGSFDGATTLDFLGKQELIDRIYIFEPNKSSFELISSRFCEYQNIEIYNKGLWDSETTLYFNSNLGSASKIEDSGVDKIETTKLDNVISDNIDFIKLDIEGAETRAIKGSERIIKAYKPILAVCVYHNQDDFIDIPKMILEFNPNYKIYLRHYTQGVFETVMYFIP